MSYQHTVFIHWPLHYSFNSWPFENVKTTNLYMVRILQLQHLDLSTKYITLHFGQDSFSNHFNQWTKQTSTATFYTYQGYKKF